MHRKRDVKHKINFRKHKEKETQFDRFAVNFLRFNKLTIKATPAACDQMNRFTQFVVKCHSNWSMK